MITPNDFCTYTDHTNESKRKPKIDDIILDEYLIQEGYHCMYTGQQSGMTRVRVVDKRVILITPNKLYEDLQDIIRVDNKPWLQPLKDNWKLLTPIAMQQMRRIEPKILRDTATTSYVPFENGIVTITRKGIELKPYAEVLVEKSCIMADKIIQRKVDMSFSDYKKGVWYKFCENAVGSEGLPYLMRSIGYLLTNYKDRSNSKMIIFVDADHPQNLNAEGGTGKSLIAKTALSAIRNVFYSDGKQGSEKQRFRFQGVNRMHDIICIDDVDRDFKHGAIYNAITGDFATEEKYKSQEVIVYEESPKFVITANFKLKLKGGSDNRRSCVIAFTDHYSEKHTPYDEFGHRFFEEWNGTRSEEFQYFYAFMFHCIQLYLSKGIENYNFDDTTYVNEELLERIHNVKHHFIGANNAMRYLDWRKIIAMEDENALDVLKDVMRLEGYVINNSIRRRIDGQANASQLYYFEKK